LVGAEFLDRVGVCGCIGWVVVSGVFVLCEMFGLVVMVGGFVGWGGPDSVRCFVGCFEFSLRWVG